MCYLQETKINKQIQSSHVINYISLEINISVALKDFPLSPTWMPIIRPEKYSSMWEIDKEDKDVGNLLV